MNENSDTFMSITTRHCFWKIFIKFIDSFNKYLSTFSALDAIIGIWDISIKIITIIIIIYSSNKRKNPLLHETYTLVDILFCVSSKAYPECEFK